MAKVIAGILALVALAASILSGVEPVACLLRAVIAYVVGWFAAQLWYVFFTIRVQSHHPARVAGETRESTQQ